MNWFLNGEEGVSIQNTEGKDIFSPCRKQERRYSERGSMAFPWNGDFIIVSGLLVHLHTRQ